MSTPFQKAFPNADENTVFEVVEYSSEYSVGNKLKLSEDDGTASPIFTIEGQPYRIQVHLSDIRIKEPQLKKGDRCLVGDCEDSWEGGEGEYVCDISKTFGIEGGCHLINFGFGEFTVWKYAKPLAETQTVTLQDGTELTIPNDAVDKLREEYA